MELVIIDFWLAIDTININKKLEVIKSMIVTAKLKRLTKSKVKMKNETIQEGSRIGLK